MFLKHFARAMTALAILVVGAASLPATVRAQTSRIEKIDSTAVTGSAYARLRRLTYDQCEKRCLSDRRCVALEFHEGEAGRRRSFNCALFSSIGQTRKAANTIVGLKRTETVRKSVEPERRAYRRVAPQPPPPRPSPSITSRDPARNSGSSGPTIGTGRVSPGQGYGSGYGTGPQPSVPAYRRKPLSEESERSAQSQAELAARAAAEARARAEAEARARAQESQRRATSPSPSASPDTREPRAGASRSIASDRTRSVAPAPAVTAPSPSPVEAAPAAAPAPPDPALGYHIVPVFYGTDRDRKDTAKRIVYGADRARRLEMGQALVTVPLSHKVPNIERPSAWTLPWFGTVWQGKEDPKQHFTIKEIKALGKDALLELVRKRLAESASFKDQALVFIHGYNVGFDDSLYRTAQITYDLQFDGAAFTYSWPSGTGWTSYPYDRDSAQQAEPYLYQFLQMVQNETGTKSINIIAHSMGNQILLQVLRDLKRRSPAVSNINQIVLAAPDVDRDAFEFLASEIRGIAKGITLYASASDKALDASRIFAGNRPRAGDVPSPPESPVVVAGIDTIDISAVSTSYLALNHSSYAEHTELLTDLNHLIRTGLRPPNLRITAYRRIDAPSGGSYWRYGN